MCAAAVSQGDGSGSRGVDDNDEASDEIRLQS